MDQVLVTPAAQRGCIASGSMLNVCSSRSAPSGVRARVKARVRLECGRTEVWSKRSTADCAIVCRGTGGRSTASVM